MVLKVPCLKSHIDRHRHEKDRKQDLNDAVVKIEKLSSSTERSQVDKTIGVTEKFNKISVVIDKYDKLGSTKTLPDIVIKSEKIDKIVDPKRHRYYQRKSTTPSENSNEAGHFEIASQTATMLQSTTESSSASNSPKPRRRKRKHADLETFHNTTPAMTPTTCRIIVEPSEIVIRDASSPPPLALLSKRLANLYLFFFNILQIFFLQ